jgi:hypothetical protein
MRAILASVYSSLAGLVRQRLSRTQSFEHQQLSFLSLDCAKYVLHPCTMAHNNGSPRLITRLELLCRRHGMVIVNEIRQFLLSRPKKTNDLYYRHQEQLLVSTII